VIAQGGSFSSVSLVAAALAAAALLLAVLSMLPITIKRQLA